jgi:hypothetical protein
MNAPYFLGDAVVGTPTRPKATAVAAPPLVGLHHSCCREILRMAEENARLRDELAEVRTQFEDLTKSAEIWIRLYETYSTLATRRAAELAGATDSSQS